MKKEIDKSIYISIAALILIILLAYGVYKSFDIFAQYSLASYYADHFNSYNRVALERGGDIISTATDFYKLDMSYSEESLNELYELLDALTFCEETSTFHICFFTFVFRR